MDKASRILTLFVRLLNGDILNKKDLSKSASIGEKSIQRYIKDLNNFFYESDYWNNKNTRVIYNRSKNGYQLINKSYSDDSLALLSLLIKIKSLTPILHKSVYDLFEKNISNKRLENRYILKNVLNHFKVRKEQKLPGEKLMKLQESITRKLKSRVEFDQKIIVKPLTLMYMHYDYWLTYEYNDKLYTKKVRDICSINILEQSPFKSSTVAKYIKFEIDLSIWSQFKQQFYIK